MASRLEHTPVPHSRGQGYPPEQDEELGNGSAPPEPSEQAPDPARRSPPSHSEAFYGSVSVSEGSESDRGSSSRGAPWPLVVGGGVILLVVIGVIVAFQFDQVSDHAEPRRLIGLVWPWRDSTIAGAMAVGLFALISALGVPVTMLILLITLIFGMWLGSGYAYAGLMAGAMLGYWAGRSMGQATLRRVLGDRLDGMIHTVRKADIVSLSLLRFVPVTPFAVANLAAGATGVRHGSYIVSTAIASVPGVLGVALIGNQLGQVLSSPSIESVGLLVAVMAGVAGLAYLLKRLIMRQGRDTETED